MPGRKQGLISFRLDAYVGVPYSEKYLRQGKMRGNLLTLHEQAWQLHSHCCCHTAQRTAWEAQEPPGAHVSFLRIERSSLTQTCSKGPCSHGAPSQTGGSLAWRPRQTLSSTALWPPNPWLVLLLVCDHQRLLLGWLPGLPARRRGSFLLFRAAV